MPAPAMNKRLQRLNPEHVAVAMLVALGAVHVFIFSALFPFFQVTDEQAHLDMVIKYSQAHFPVRYAEGSSNTAFYCVLYGAPEYLQTGPPPEKTLLPLWSAPAPLIEQSLAEFAGSWTASPNIESAQPPLYYSIAGGWWAWCRAMGLDGGNVLYALRCLNGLFLMGTILVGWLAARLIFPENRFVRIAVPALIACQPQSIYYCISNDNLAALTFGLVFLLILKCWSRDVLSLRLGAALGLSFAAVFLTKLTGVPLLMVAALMLLLKVCFWVKQNKFRSSFPGLLAMSACAGAPCLAWLVWCKVHFGDWTGDRQKIQFLSWTLKPVAEWFHHPIFSISGCAYFIGRNISTFWQGEALWYRQRLAEPLADGFYICGILISLGLVFIFLILRPQRFSSLQRAALWFAMVCLGSLFLFFAWQSVRYDFHGCFYPSSALPYFTSGRLLLGAVIPALVIFAKSLDLLLLKANGRLKFGALAVLLLAMLATEIHIDHPVFRSLYDWIHM